MKMAQATQQKKRKHSIDKAIREQEDNDEFNEMTAQLAEKVMKFLGMDEEGELDAELHDDSVDSYEELKDVIREHITSWYENGDTSNVEEEKDGAESKKEDSL